MFSQYREHALHDIIKTMCDSVDGIEAAVVINIDGLVVSSYPAVPSDDPHDPMSTDSVAATASMLIGLAEQTLRRLDHGELDRAMIEGSQGVMAVYPATSDSALAVLIAKGAKLGLALTAARHTAADIRNVLGR